MLGLAMEAIVTHVNDTPSYFCFYSWIIFPQGVHNRIMIQVAHLYLVYSFLLIEIECNHSFVNESVNQYKLYVLSWF